mmetsp:Transcript_88008/g.244278  ORF Transcript_88008/g.244278 Transcript_88008/m.244278 type:complete len:182 (-) Transcript_88008:731-1276(-)
MILHPMPWSLQHQAFFDSLHDVLKFLTSKLQLNDCLSAAQPRAAFLQHQACLSPGHVRAQSANPAMQSYFSAAVAVAVLRPAEDAEVDPAGGAYVVAAFRAAERAEFDPAGGADAAVPGPVGALELALVALAAAPVTPELAVAAVVVAPEPGQPRFTCRQHHFFFSLLHARSDRATSDVQL